MADDDQPAAHPVAEPFYEPIGANSGGSGSSSWEDDDDGGREQMHGGRPGMQLAVADAGRSIRTVRFWALAGSAVVGTWAASAAAVVMFASLGQGSGGYNAPMLVYALAATLMPSVAACLAVAWGMQCQRHVAAATEPAVGGVVLPALLATTFRGFILAALAFCVLMLQSLAAGGPGTVAAAAAGVIAVEGTVFGAVGVGVAATAGKPRLARVAGLALAGILVAGSAGGAAALVPLVRVVEPVTVAVNVQWGPAGTRQAYQCSEVPAGVAEVYHTERIMWLAAFSPSVVFLALGADADPAGVVLGWVPSAMQEAGDGTQVPCVNGEPLAKDSARMPLPVVGIAGQAIVAGVLLAAGSRTAGSRRRPRT
ncbi:hypothetical protein Q9R30_07860 [Arthrobacter sp. AB6]|uniref:hypothetical protein n=1 Tax=Arthrobacter sp. AB6 TaxID=2962570 RepID=UPI0028824B62|nr:hypothetical protein [Arthrobacter sp. AB6]MDT0195268.1 hypothetical protein [Arthrobacter sp. AB6]